jgi:hypothetical protein
MTNKKTATEASAHYEVYAEHSRTLKAWLVGYGVAVPAIILNQKDLWEKLANSGNIECIAMLFITGVLLQVVISVINRMIMWISYYGNHSPEFKKMIVYVISEKLTHYYLIDLIFDLLTTATYTYATYLCFQSLRT